MRIGITGTMSVGKTTLVKALSKLPQFKDYHIATERSEYLRDLGIPLNTNSTVLGQLIFTAERATELIHDNIITDRTIWDVCAFTSSSNNINSTDKSILTNNISLLRDKYDYVFYINPDGIDLEYNGVRETDINFRKEVDYLICGLLALNKPKNILTISGTTEERISQILSYIK